MHAEAHAVQPQLVIIIWRRPHVQPCFYVIVCYQFELGEVIKNEYKNHAQILNFNDDN